MGVRLDWEIEADQQSYGSTEDVKTARRRRGARLRFIIILSIFIGLIALGVTLVRDRADQVTEAEQRQLLDIVDAEVAALRLGDWTAYSRLQRGASADEWLSTQREQFDVYQALKLEGDIQLTGQVLDLEIDGQRARVHVQEIIDGIPYTRIWFYWRWPDDQNQDDLPDGWRHGPPDYADFWGDEQIYESDQLTIVHRDVDVPFVDVLATQLETWIQMGCDILTCEQRPSIAVSVEPNPGLTTQWAQENQSQLRIQSPYIDGTRSDQPFTSEMQIEIASLLAERLVSQRLSVEPSYPSDAYYLKQAVISWMVGRFAQVNTNSLLIESLASNYGNQAVGQLVGAMQATSSIDVLSAATQLPLDQSNLDWRDFLTWRLVLEDELVARGDSVNFLNLYDTRTQEGLNLANTRYSQGGPAEPVVVILVQMAQPTGDGTPRLQVTAEFGSEGQTRQEAIVFNLVNNIWQRGN